MPWGCKELDTTEQLSLSLVTGVTTKVSDKARDKI